MPEAFRIKYFIPQEYEVPEELQYNYMIHFICKAQGISKHAAGKYKETDFWELLAFENLDNLKQEYLMKEYLNK
ncbi:MAG: hypothetical protein EHM58_03115 [Ignavibacteriae bacterium]|nr:MAG: hypothetical protein EHM58_03115 [Ignavibacteriota bacterium]